MNNQLTKTDLVTEITELFTNGGNPNMLEPVKKYVHSLTVMGIINQLTPNQAYQFIKTAWELKLDPLKKEIYAIPRNTPEGTVLTITVSYLEYLKRASLDPEFVPPNLKTVTTDDQGKLLPKEYWYCEFEGYLKSRPDYKCNRRFYLREWASKNYKGEYFGSWATKPIYMLEKTALKNGLVWLYPKATDLDRIFREEENGIKISGENVYVENIKDTEEKALTNKPLPVVEQPKVVRTTRTKKVVAEPEPEIITHPETGKILGESKVLNNNENLEEKLETVIKNLGGVVPETTIKKYWELLPIETKWQDIEFIVQKILEQVYKPE